LIRSEYIDVGPSSVNYKDTTYWRLYPRILTSGKIFDYSEGYGVEQLLKRNVVYEIGGRNRNLQRFLQQILFAKVYEYLLAHNMRNQGLNLAFIVDEAKQLFSVYQEMQEASGMPESGDQVAKARFLGLSAIAADQEATKLTESLKANTDTKVLLPVNNSKQLDSIADAMHLTELQKRYIRSLDVGQAVIQHGSNNPVAVDLNNHTLQSHVNDEELEERMKSQWQSLEHSERKPGKLNLYQGTGSSNESGDDSSLSEYL
jgi:peptidyl-tRNA hydrolase